LLCVNNGVIDIQASCQFISIHTHIHVRPSGESLTNYVALQWAEFGQPWT